METKQNTNQQNRADETTEDISFKKTVTLATVAISLGLSLGVPVGSALAANQNQPGLHQNNNVSNQIKHSNQIKDSNQGKFSNQIKLNQSKNSNQLKSSNQSKTSNQLKIHN